MAFWTDDFLGKIRDEWKSRISKVQYCIDEDYETWYDGVIDDISVVDDTIIMTSAIPENAASNVYAIRLVDDDGDVAGIIYDSIGKDATQGILTRWEFPIYELTQ